jgi:DNA helicase-2/ATP-dependent DNA helicase PcrA
LDDYQRDFREETKYLEQTLACIQDEIEKGTGSLQSSRNNLIASRKDMWENTVHFSNDFARLTELNQYLAEVNRQTATYINSLNRIEKLKKMIGSPYFGRFDFVEDGFEEREKIYVGLGNVMDPATNDIYVFDWRAPICSIFYRHELGPATYEAPIGLISGEVLLKRQYKIQNSQLEYFFDCSIQINDEILQEVLSRNSSAKMRNIVETIQKEQDIIIRDTTNELLMVQGVAGSGKTSIALHRIAFLLYDGLKSNIRPENFLIISPNTIFSQYISSVLPELGEKNVGQITFDELARQVLAGRLKLETRNAQLESLIASQGTTEGELRRRSIEFKGSAVFQVILDRLLEYYARHLIPFADVYYNGEIIETRQQLKNQFLHKKFEQPMARRLEKIKQRILEKVHSLRKLRLKKIEEIVQKSEGHDLEIKSFSRLLSIKETKVFMERLRRFTEVDYEQVYQVLFNEPQLFLKLARGLELPAEILPIISTTRERLDQGWICYEDIAPLLYLRLRIEGGDFLPQIRQVIIDEAQDYYPLQYEVFKRLFKVARYTVLGDIQQGIVQDADQSLYKKIADTLGKKKAITLHLNKSYRSSYEISRFAQNLLGKKQDGIPFERHDAEPIVVFQENEERVDQSIARDLEACLEQGYKTVAVICKTRQEAHKVRARLKKLTNQPLINPGDGELPKGAVVIPVYLAKGLEFDVVLVYGADRDNYSSEYDRKLLYVACTRALHRLALYYTGEKSRFL